MSNTGKGKIVIFDWRRGWGYVRCEGSAGAFEHGEDVFFHVSNSPDFHAALGMEVEFELAPPFKLGQLEQAVNLRKVESGVGGAQ